MESGSDAFNDLSSFLPPGLSNFPETIGKDPLSPDALSEMEKMISSLTKLGIDGGSNAVNSDSSVPEPAAIASMMAEVEKLTGMLEKMGPATAGADASPSSSSAEEMTQLMKLLQMMGSNNLAKP